MKAAGRDRPKDTQNLSKQVPKTNFPFQCIAINISIEENTIASEVQISQCACEIPVQRGVWTVEAGDYFSAELGIRNDQV